MHLEFKAGKALGSSEGKRKEMCKDISAFANANGGYIIYGLTEENHVPKELSPVSGSIYSKEWLEHVINGGINKPISGLKIYPIRLEGDIKRSIYVVQIPESNDVPHQSKDYKLPYVYPEKEKALQVLDSQGFIQLTCSP